MMSFTERERLVIALAARAHQRMAEAEDVDPLEAYCPQVPTTKQAEFLAHDELEVLFGGSAGPGKSSALLMAALKYVDRPNYSALILRRTYADLALPGAIMDRAGEWLRPTAAQWHDKLKQWRFPSGSVLQFGYLENENDKYRYQGSELQFCAFDELTQFSQTQYLYLMSRLRRSTANDVPLRMRSASNPGGVGHDWVHERFVKESTRDGRIFVPALLGDNPHLDAAEYRKALEQLDSTTRAQLLQGLWIRDSHGLVYRYNNERNGIDEIPKLIRPKYILAIDLGAAQNKPTTAFCVIAFSYQVEDFVAVVESEKRAAMIPSTIAARIKELNEEYDFVSIVADAGALGKGYVEEFRQRYALPVKPAKKADKLGYRKLINGDLERGVLRVVRPTCETLIEEMCTLSWDEEGLDCEEDSEDHETDAMLYGWREAKHWLSTAPAVIPEHGTDERYVYEADLMRKNAIRAAEQKIAREERHGLRRRRRQYI